MDPGGLLRCLGEAEEVLPEDEGGEAAEQAGQTLLSTELAARSFSVKSDFTSAMMSSSGTICPDLPIWTSWWNSKTSGPLLETRPLEARPLESLEA